MTSIIEKTKSWTSVMMALVFTLAITMSACNTSQTTDEEETETTEMQTTESDEHPSEGAEHPAESDTTEVADEHPSEHPDN